MKLLDMWAKVGWLWYGDGGPLLTASRSGTGGLPRSAVPTSVRPILEATRLQNFPKSSSSSLLGLPEASVREALPEKPW